MADDQGRVVLVALVLAFLFTALPRDALALSAAGVLLLSRRTASRQVIGLVDWHLLVLFIGIFVVNQALADSGELSAGLRWLAGFGVGLARPAVLFVTTVVPSNLVSNVPAAMLLLPTSTHALAGPVVGLSSTLVGDSWLVGSIANLIVVEQAAQLGVWVSWRAHAKVGVPVTLLTRAPAAMWLFVRGD